jgi:hypothetical protein
VKPALPVTKRRQTDAKLISSMQDSDASRSGQVLPKRMRRAMRHATIMDTSKARSTQSIFDNWRASTLRPFFSTLKYGSISHRA